MSEKNFAINVSMTIILFIDLLELYGISTSHLNQEINKNALILHLKNVKQNSKLWLLVSTL